MCTFKRLLWLRNSQKRKLKGKNGGSEVKLLKEPVERGMGAGEGQEEERRGEGG
jgi:hypothetical protein